MVDFWRVGILEGRAASSIGDVAGVFLLLLESNHEGSMERTEPAEFQIDEALVLVERDDLTDEESEIGEVLPDEEVEKAGLSGRTEDSDIHCDGMLVTKLYIDRGSYIAFQR